MFDRDEFDRYLDEAVAFHGHLCAGQIIGVRLAMLGLRELGLDDPRGQDRKKLIVYVEMERCATDAVMTVTGCRVGRRNMKVIDYGKMAATFVNVDNERAVRITSLQSSRAKAAEMYPGLGDNEAQMRAYRELPDKDLFQVQDVAVNIRPEDMPGRPLGKEVCAVCGETVLDLREVRSNGATLCRPCAQGAAYYSISAEPRMPKEEEVHEQPV